jgi:hypothetical protein
MVLAGGTIQGIMHNVWVRQRWLGADGGGRGGQQRQGSGGRGLLFFRIGHVLVVWAPRSGGDVFLYTAFLLSIFILKNSQDHLF